jgi:hypothetical protein
LVCMGLRPGACRHADSVKVGTCWLGMGSAPPADKGAAMQGATAGYPAWATGAE